MKLSQCAVLIAVSDSGSFTKAARVLGVSQSGVSHAIAALESELHCELLDRTRSGARLTATGRAVLVHARSIVAHAEQIRQAAQDTRTEVRFATSQTFGTRLLPALVAEFRERFPRQELHLREGTDQQIATWLRRHTIDVGVVTLPKPDVTTVGLWRDELVAVLPAGHRLAAAPAVDIGRLADEPLLMPVGGVEPVVRAASRLVGTEPVISHRMRDLNALLAMVAGGLGGTVLPELALPSSLRGVRVLPLRPVLTRQVALGIRDGAGGCASVTGLVDIATGLARGSDHSPGKVA